MPNLSENIEFDDNILHVKFFYEKGEASVFDYGDGSGYPGSSDAVYIKSVISEDGFDVTEYFEKNQSEMEALEEIIINRVKN